MSSYGDYPRGTGDAASRKEPTGFETAQAIGSPTKQPSREQPPARQDAPAQDEAPTVDEAPRIGWRGQPKAQQEQEAAAAEDAGTEGYADDDPWFGKNAPRNGYVQ
ncbi:hypothetical protein GA0061083_0011 [Pseudarthrobacter enclensis]|uniref:hypothetical protein n=1 Tax=Pseudarthrobacter enclensis TaxID=993070 RepID=UPI0008162E6D|nr:hypothetical protein [Pseudarthrobacter enclensis]SCC29668.1 hypothetical protein GA0061083_0011 [Pseudarthrobacter enclensis]